MVISASCCNSITAITSLWYYLPAAASCQQLLPCGNICQLLHLANSCYLVVLSASCCNFKTLLPCDIICKLLQLENSCYLVILSASCCISPTAVLFTPLCPSSIHQSNQKIIYRMFIKYCVFSFSLEYILKTQ